MAVEAGQEDRVGQALMRFKNWGIPQRGDAPSNRMGLRGKGKKKVQFSELLVS